MHRHLQALAMCFPPPPAAAAANASVLEAPATPADLPAGAAGLSVSLLAAAAGVAAAVLAL
jgi:hypothetical protein